MMLPPYADFLGITEAEDEHGQAYVILPPAEHVYGRPGFIHGGAIAGVLEIAMHQALHRALGPGERPRVKPVNVSVDYLRGAELKPLLAQGRIIRLGRNIANVSAEAWQDDRSRPMATARMHMLLDPRK